MPKSHIIVHTAKAVLLNGDLILKKSDSSISGSPLNVDVYSALTDRIRSGDAGIREGDQFEYEGSVFASVRGRHLVLEV